MKVLLAILAASASLAVPAGANASEALAKSSGCLNCHNVEGAKKIGPALKEISAKYKGKADAEATLVGKIGGAKGHPAVKASPEDVKALVKWVLTL